MFERTARSFTFFLPLAALFSIATAHAEEPDAREPDAGEAVYPRAYDGFQAGRDAQDYWEARRRDAINRQLGWNEFYRWRAATGDPTTLYYDPYLPHAPYGRYGYDLFSAPWLGAPGPVLGYGYYDAVPQPIGRRQVQTGPNRWESFPVYAEDLLEKEASPRPPRGRPLRAPSAPPKFDPPDRAPRGISPPEREPRGISPPEREPRGISPPEREPRGREF